MQSSKHISKISFIIKTVVSQPGLSFFLLAACAPSHQQIGEDLKSLGAHPRFQSQEKIIGENDLLPVNGDASNLPKNLQPLASAVGQLNVGCTATHIGNGLALTAGHCVSVSPRSSSSSCRSLGIVWGNRGTQPTLSVSKCLQIVERKYTGGLDFALLKIENPPSTFIPVETENPQSSRFVTMLSFPRMRPLEWSKNCEIREYNNPSLATLKFFHDCDSESGSSGAAIIDQQTLKIVGIHGGAGDEFNYGMFSSGFNLKIPKPAL
jgi:hypothetical protein